MKVAKSWILGFKSGFWHKSESNPFITKN